jgi:hypothetical protein
MRQNNHKLHGQWVASFSKKKDSIASASASLDA